MTHRDSITNLRGALLLTLVLLLLPAAAPAVPGGLTLKWKVAGQGDVIFDGTAHEKKRLTCDACHVAGLFQTKYRADRMTMAAMKEGKFCGYCHNGKRAFSVAAADQCRRCHSGPKTL